MSPSSRTPTRIKVSDLREGMRVSCDAGQRGELGYTEGILFVERNNNTWLIEVDEAKSELRYGHTWGVADNDGEFWKDHRNFKILDEQKNDSLVPYNYVTHA